MKKYSLLTVYFTDILMNIKIFLLTSIIICGAVIILCLTIKDTSLALYLFVLMLFMVIMLCLIPSRHTLLNIQEKILQRYLIEYSIKYPEAYERYLKSMERVKKESGKS